MRLRLFPTLALALTTLVVLGGCSNRTATFPGHSDPEVWNAMVTVAENPVYDDWHVFENEVMTARPEGRLEIFRILRRDLVRPGTNPVRQEEDWRFNVQFLNSDPPTIKFTARQASIPAHVWREADRYFADMRTILERDASVRTEDILVEELVIEEAPVEESTKDSDAVELEPTTADELGDLLDSDGP